MKVSCLYLVFGAIESFTNLLSKINSNEILRRIKKKYISINDIHDVPLHFYLLPESNIDLLKVSRNSYTGFDKLSCSNAMEFSPHHISALNWCLPFACEFWAQNFGLNRFVRLFVFQNNLNEDLMNYALNILVCVCVFLSRSNSIAWIENKNFDRDINNEST